MAKFNMNMPEDIFGNVLNAEFEDIAEEALEKAGPVLKRATENVLSGHGSLADSIKISKPKRGSNDAWILNANPSGTIRHEDGSTIRAVEAAVYLENGTSRKGKGGPQPPRPWVARATNAAEAEVLEICQKVYEEKTK